MRCVLEVWQRFWDRLFSIRIKELIRKVLKNEVRFGGVAPGLGSSFDQDAGRRTQDAGRSVFSPLALMALRGL